MKVAKNLVRRGLNDLLITEQPRYLYLCYTWNKPMNMNYFQVICVFGSVKYPCARVQTNDVFSALYLFTI